MATTSSGVNPPKESTIQITEGETKFRDNAPKYVDLLKPKVHMHENIKITPKSVVMMHGEPSITWKASEVQTMIL